MDVEPVSVVINPWDSLEERVVKMVELCPYLEPFYKDYQEIKARLAHQSQEREELVKKCHPDGKCWPPHPDCPACQKLIQKYVMKTLKPNIEIDEANSLLHSVAAVLGEQSRDKLYNQVQYARDSGDPTQIAQAVLCNMLVLTLEEIKCEESSKSS